MSDISAESAVTARPRKPRVHQVMVRFTDDGAAILDRLRGTKSRQDYLRDLVAAEYVTAKKKGRI
jgi:hypothetical protein